MANTRKAGSAARLLSALALAAMAETANLYNKPAWGGITRKADNKPWLRKKKGRS